MIQIPAKEIQLRIWGYYTEEIPPENSYRAACYKLLETDPSEATIEKLALTSKRMSDEVENLIVKPSLETTANKN